MGVGVDATLALHVVGVEVAVYVVGKGGLQAWVTLTDVQGVGVIGDVQQIGHAGLVAASPVTQEQVGVLVEVPS